MTFGNVNEAYNFYGRYAQLETVETFEQVFNAFKTCMGIEGPMVMLTNMIYA